MFFTMKKNLLLLFCFVSSFVFSQKYHFDYYFHYDSENHHSKGVEKREKKFLINSKNHNYEAVFKNVNKKRKILKIISLKDNVEHYFDVKNDNHSMSSENFTYKYSKKIPDTKKQFEDEFERRSFTAESVQNNNNQYSIKEFTKNGIGAIAVADAKFIKFKDDLSFVGLRLLLDAQDIDKKLKFNENYILKSGTNKFGDTEVKLSLEAVEPQNFDLIIEKIKF